MSTNAIRKFPLAAVCTVLFVLCIPGGKGQGFSQLDPCYWTDGLFEVIENSASNTLTCSVFDPYRVEWYWRTNGTEERGLGYCRMGFYCNNRYPSSLFSLSPLPNGASKLTINTTDMTLFSRPQSFTNSTLACREEFPVFESRKCRTDLIYPAKDSSCSAQFQTSPHKPLVATCNIPKAYSALQRYSCQVFIAEEAVGSPVSMVTTLLGTDYVSGSCSMTSVLPSVDGNITVMIIPGRINVTASSIRQPSARVNHTCPEYVDEGSNLGCTCTTDDRGSPPGFLQWQGSSSADLSRASVSRADCGTVFTCHLLWNATVVASATYTLRVTCSDLIRQARAEGLTTGIGIGLGVGLVVALIAVAVHVVVSLRRGASLLCAAYTTTRRAEAMHSMETSNISECSREGDGAVATPESGNEGLGLYEDIRRDEVNVPSTYEDLRPRNQPEASAAPSPTETRRVYDNRAFVSDTDQRGDAPAENTTPKTIRAKKQCESADYSNV